MRAFDIQRAGVEGELYVFATLDPKGESWDAGPYLMEEYAKTDPRASQLSFPETSVCVHGIQVRNMRASAPASARIDFRGADIPPLALSREHISLPRLPGGFTPGIRSRWIEVLKDHLASSTWARGEDAWKYKQSLVDHFRLPNFWASLPGTIPVYSKPRRLLVSLNELLAQTNIALIVAPQEPGFEVPTDRTGLPEPEWNQETWALFGMTLTGSPPRTAKKYLPGER